MTDFHIKPKVYNQAIGGLTPFQQSAVKKVNTYQETKQSTTEKNKRWREFIESRLKKMGLKKIK